MTTDEHGTEPAKGTRARAAQAGAATARRKGSGRATQRPPDPAARRGRTTTAKGGDSGSGPGARSRPLDPDQLAALVEERDFLLRSLRDLDAEHEAGDVDDGDYAALEDDYTARAAAAIRAIDGHRSRQARPRPPRSMTRRVLVAAAVAVFAVGTGVLVAQWSGTRGVGDSITGGIRSDTRDELVAARQYAGAGQYLQAIKSYDGVLKIDPANIEALAYKGWMYRLVSLQATGTQRTELQSEAQASLRLALATDPKDPTSLVFMASLLDDLGQPKAALSDLDAVPAGQLPSVMSGLIGQLRARLQSELGPSASAASTTSTSTTTSTSSG